MRVQHTPRAQHFSGYRASKNKTGLNYSLISIPLGQLSPYIMKCGSCCGFVSKFARMSFLPKCLLIASPMSTRSFTQKYRMLMCRVHSLADRPLSMSAIVLFHCHWSTLVPLGDDDTLRLPYTTHLRYSIIFFMKKYTVFLQVFTLLIEITDFRCKPHVFSPFISVSGNRLTTVLS
jgi:hypothetical protein